MISHPYSQSTSVAIVQGRISGQNGPMRASFVVASEAGSSSYEPKVIASADSSGVYRLELPAAGAWLVAGIGVGHRRMELPVVVEAGEELQLNLRLAATPAEGLEAMALIHGRLQYGMHKDENGSFHSDVPAEGAMADIELNSNIGQLDYLHAPEYRFASGRIVASVPAQESRMRITVSVADYPREPGQPGFELPGSPRNRKFVAHHRRFNERLAQLRAEPRDDEWLNKAAALINGARSAAAAESEPLAAAYLRARALCEKAAIDAQAAGRDAPGELAAIPARSPVWAFAAITNLGSIPQCPEVETYLGQVLESTPAPLVRAAALQALYDQALMRGDLAAADQRVQRLRDDFSGSRWERAVVRHWRNLRAPGTPLPLFAALALEGGKSIKGADYQGRALLIALWSIGCPYCVRSMPQLHELHEKHHAGGFEILGIASEHVPESVSKFREQWPMPWDHVFVHSESKKEAPIIQALELADEGVPTFILVDRQGIVRLRGSGANMLPQIASALPDILAV